MDQYETQLTPKQEVDFQLWKRKFAPNDSGKDYDFRGAFLTGQTPEGGHWSDLFKKPNHPTFSEESIYAFGDNLKLAGKWVDNQFISPTGKVPTPLPLLNVIGPDLKPYTTAPSDPHPDVRGTIMPDLIDKKEIPPTNLIFDPAADIHA